MARLTLVLLGGLEARLDAGPPLVLPAGKTQALLAYLALPLGQAHLREQLAALLWGELPADAARHGLRQALFVLRKALGAATPLRVDGESVALDPAAVAVDVALFERRVVEGTPTALEAAAALYRGDLLAGLSFTGAPFEEWLLGERERLRERAVEGLARLLAHQRTAGDLEAAVRTTLRLLALDPLQEAVHRTLMRLYAQVGRRGAALRQYQLCTAALDRELGVEPEPETQALYREILQRRGAIPGPAETEPGTARRRPIPSADPERPPEVPPETPLVGREPELARLREALDLAWAARGRLVAIFGEAGLGKSRLVAELVAEALGRGGRVLLGRAYESQQILPFGPWVDALRAGYVARDAALAGLDPVWRRELARLLPELGVPDAPPGPDAPESRRLFESLAQLLERLAEAAPLLLVLEDLHWADETSLRLLGFLGRRIERGSVLIVVTVRAEELSDAPMLRHTLDDLAQERDLVRLALAPLSHEETLALVRRLARPGSEAAALARLEEQVWATSEGNPFMIVELVRALRDGTTLLTRSGLTLPERVREVVARRLERLGGRARDVLAVAAVIGREFEFGLLQRAAGVDEREAAEGVEELVRRRVLHGVGERFDFAHDAIRATVLTQLLRPRARLLHRRVAEALEALHAGDLGTCYAALGWHYREAQVWDRAVRFLRLAGAQALERWAYREARASFEQARAAVERLPEGREAREHAVDVRIDLHRALVPLGEPRRSGELLREAEALARALDDPLRLGWVSAYATNCAWLAADLDQALELGTRARTLAEAHGDTALRVVASFYLGQVLHFRGEYRRAVEILAPMVPLVDGDRARERFGLPGLPAALARGWMAWSLAELGEFPEALAHADAAVHLAEAADDAFTMLDAYRERGYLALRQGEGPTAVAVLERALALCHRRDVTLWLPSIEAALGAAYALSGCPEDGAGLLERAVAQAATLGIRAGQALRVAWLGEAYVLAGRWLDAGRLVDAALETARARGERGYEAWALRLQGELAARRDAMEPEPAEAAFQGAMALGGALGMRPLLAHCQLGLARLHQRTGRRALAQAHRATALAAFRDLGMAGWLARAEAELADDG